MRKFEKFFPALCPNVPGCFVTEVKGVLYVLIYLQVIDVPEERGKFERLYHEYQGLMYYVANRILNNPHEAEEVVHDAFLAVLENFSKISEVECPKTRSFLVTIVENKAINLYNRKKRHPQEKISPAMADPKDMERHAEDPLARCILRLPPQYREVILLRYEQGFTPKEVAEILGKSMDATYKLEQRAKSRLEELCQEEGIII